MILVINEWIFHDLLGENGPEAFEASRDFVKRLFQSTDWIVMPNEQRWRNKAYQLMTSVAPELRQVSQRLHSLLRDSNRCIILNPNDIPGTPQSTYDWAPPEDVYLIEAYVTAGADILVTTDETLYQAIAEHGQFTCRIRDEFLSSYCPAN